MTPISFRSAAIPVAAALLASVLAASAASPAKPTAPMRDPRTATLAESLTKAVVTPAAAPAKPAPTSGALSPDSMAHRVQRALGEPVGASGADIRNGPPVDVAIPGFWRTRAERTGWHDTADYDETMRYCRQLEAGSRWVKLVSYGKSGQGRDLPMLIVSKDRAFTAPAARALGKPIVLIQNGIHAGEIEGKDACLALVRDLAVLRGHEDLLDSCTVLVLPIFSVDAHERRSKYNRMNQNGPDVMGWRHTPIGLNLNRDYMKAESPEMRALLGNVYTQWWPDLLIDDHTTDGADYQHDVTYNYPHGADTPASIDRWFHDAFEGRIVPRIAAMGHLPAPYLSFRKGDDPASGIDFGSSPPRFSTMYPTMHARAAILVETHMLKPYGDRVKATYDLLMATLEELHARPRLLTGAVQAAEQAAIARGRESNPARRVVVLATRTSDKSEPFAFKGKVTTREKSEITGAPVAHYISAKWDTLVPLYRDVVPTLTVQAPAGGYLIPQEWSKTIELLQFQGVHFRRLAKPYRDSVEVTRVLEWSSDPQGFEGHHMIRVNSVKLERALRSFRAGDVWVPLDQRSGTMAVHLLEAQAPDGVLAWNAFDTIFQRKEYGEDYVMEPLARQMLARDPKLAKEFANKLAADSSFAANAGARSDWFYRRSLWADPEQDLDPVVRALRPVPEALLAPPAPEPPPVVLQAPAPTAPGR